jgi:hypothetical protein
MGLSKGYVLGVGAVRVQGCGLISKQGLGAWLSAVRVLNKQINKDKAGPSRA